MIAAYLCTENKLAEGLYTTHGKYVVDYSFTFSKSADELKKGTTKIPTKDVICAALSMMNDATQNVFIKKMAQCMEGEYNFSEDIKLKSEKLLEKLVAEKTIKSSGKVLVKNVEFFNVEHID